MHDCHYCAQEGKIITFRDLPPTTYLPCLARVETGRAIMIIIT